MPQIRIPLLAILTLSPFLLCGCERSKASGAGGDASVPLPANGPVKREAYFEPLPDKIATVDLTKYLQCGVDHHFLDPYGLRWTAVKGTRTDGASIPQFFLSFIGDRFAPEYRYAALIHDAYCQECNEGGPNYHARSWREVHRMFYDALLENRRVVANTTGQRPEDVLSDTNAKLMFAAVWLRGPRWDGEVIQSPPAKSDELQKEEFGKCQTWIEKTNPDIDKIVAWMKEREPDLRNGISPPIK